MNTECESFKALSEAECEAMLSATQTYVAELNHKIEALTESVPPK